MSGDIMGKEPDNGEGRSQEDYDADIEGMLDRDDFIDRMRRTEPLSFGEAGRIARWMREEFFDEDGPDSLTELSRGVGYSLGRVLWERMGDEAGPEDPARIATQVYTHLHLEDRRSDDVYRLMLEDKLVSEEVDLYGLPGEEAFHLLEYSILLGYQGR